VKLVRTDLTVSEAGKDVKRLIDAIFENVPSGVGEKGKLRLAGRQIDDVLDGGAEWAVKQGYGREDDLASSEEGGRMKTADSSKVDAKAKQRGAPQLGTLGAGNQCPLRLRNSPCLSSSSIAMLKLSPNILPSASVSGISQAAQSTCGLRIWRLSGFIRAFSWLLPKKNSG
jgi:hypothetical protein